MGEVFLDAFLDTLKILPFLLLMNFLIEFFEYKFSSLQTNKALKGGLAPLIGTAVGVVPQCGFSVVATELYNKRKIALGTLLAVYIATSDEALPIMLSNYAGLTKVLPVIIIKVCFALVVGYAAFGIEKLIAKNRHTLTVPETALSSHSDNSDGGKHAHADAEHSDTAVESVEHKHCDGDEHDEHGDHAGHAHLHGCHHHDIDEHEKLPDNATKKQKAAWWKKYIKHPLLHTATVLLYILIVNILFGIVVYYVGEGRIADFMSATGYLQPLLAATVGLIPNCAASVVITELYIVGGLNLGGAVAGLCVGAIGYAVLAKGNRPIKNTVLVIAVMYVLSVALGMLVNFVYPLIVG